MVSCRGRRVPISKFCRSISSSFSRRKLRESLVLSLRLRKLGSPGNRGRQRRSSREEPISVWEECFKYFDSRHSKSHSLCCYKSFTEVMGFDWWQLVLYALRVMQIQWQSSMFEHTCIVRIWTIVSQTIMLKVVRNLRYHS